MAKTNAPPGTQTDIDELVSQLSTLYERRKELLDEIRRGPGTADRDAILLELCGFRGMQYTEAAAEMGYTREGVAVRVRPQLDRLGIAGLTPFERSLVEAERPLRDVPTEELVRQLRAPATKETKQAKRDIGKEARDNLAEIRKLMTETKAAGLPYSGLAERMGVSLATVQRLRGVQ